MTAGSVLLLDSNLETVSQLGAAGLAITYATHNRRDPVTSSRYVGAVEASPYVWAEDFGGWFDALVQRRPEAFILPASDELAWWVAEWRDRNPERGRRVIAPPGNALRTALAKFRLYEACVAAGVAAPRTWLATSEEAAVEGLAGVRYPVMLKPQGRVGNLHWGSGRVARDEAQLRGLVRWSAEHVRFRQPVMDSMPGVQIPMVQELVPGRDRPVYHLCGYLSGEGQFAVLAHRKLLQVPRRFGVGLCFETAPVDDRLAGRLIDMLGGIGFHGMFEAEFLCRGEEKLLIDLNTRPYNGMRLEGDRGLHLPWYAFLEAAGDYARLRSELAAAHSLDTRPGLAWCRRLDFSAMVAGQFAGGGFGVRDVRTWIAWYWRHRKTMIDPWIVPGDRRVGRVAAAARLRTWVTVPRQFLGAYVRRESSG